MLLQSIRPVAYLGYSIKPNTYGSIAARALNIPVINNIAGLGAAFIRDDYLTKVVRGLYRFALKRSHRIFFQNAEDQELFVHAGMAEKNVCGLLPGSGIDVLKYPTVPIAAPDGRRFRFLLIGRMLRDKGVQEFAGAAKLLRQRDVEAEFQLLGPIDPANANSVSVEMIRAWEQDGLVSYLGMTDDVRPYIAQADCIVLPSYREGVPRSLLEAAAMARPIIATDVVGCRDAVDHDHNGYLCKVRDFADLAEKMVQMIALTPAQRAAMGTAGRSKVEAEFDEQIVIQKYLSALTSLSPVGATISRPVSDIADLATEQLNS
jgi:glycosyltransferase involved in cell wall biosynthesis